MLLTINGIWEVIDEYDLFPVEVDENGEETALGRSRRVSQAIIGFELPEVTGNMNVRTAELRRRANKRLANRRVAFRMVKNSLTNEKALKYFNTALEEESRAWEEEAARPEAAQEQAVANALRDDPDMDPEDVPAVELPQRFLLCQRTLERCLNKIATEIVPTDTVVFQEDYIQETSKRRSMTAKQWANRLKEMRGYLYSLSDTMIR